MNIVHGLTSVVIVTVVVRWPEPPPPAFGVDTCGVVKVQGVPQGPVLGEFGGIA